MALVGADGENDGVPPTSFPGAVFVYVRSGASLHQQAKLADPGRAAADFFGVAVALSGATALVGANGVKNGAGAAYIYLRSGASWHRQAVLADPSHTSNDDFGRAVGLSGGIAVIGAPFANNFAGAVYVYARSGRTWHRQAVLTYPDHSPGDEFGHDLAISGMTLAVTAPGSRKVYVYVRARAAWRLQATLTGPDHTAFDEFGTAVAVFGATAAISDLEGPHGGAVYLYSRKGTIWRRQATVTDPGRNSSDGFGVSVALSRATAGMRLLVGVPTGDLPNCGTAYDYAPSGRTWREKARVINPGCTANDGFGLALAMWRRTALIGAPFQHKDAGAAYVLAIP
jgi:hypothetical protein